MDNIDGALFQGLPLTTDFEEIDGRTAVRLEDGTIFYLDTLSEAEYWLYMELREMTWHI